jgi:hypothetical protein
LVLDPITRSTIQVTDFYFINTKNNFHSLDIWKHFYFMECSVTF